jgi:predicted RNA-binding Zn-ribbon protein involved in translation (DUF1610 family)
MPVNIIRSTTANIIRRDHSLDIEFEDGGMMYAVSFDWSSTGNSDEIDEYGLDYEYFYFNGEAELFVEMNVLAPETCEDGGSPVFCNRLSDAIANSTQKVERGVVFVECKSCGHSLHFDANKNTLSIGTIMECPGCGKEITDFVDK